MNDIHRSSVRHVYAVNVAYIAAKRTAHLKRAPIASQLLGIENGALKRPPKARRHKQYLFIAMTGKLGLSYDPGVDD